MANQIEIVFKEEIRGKNALHFWIGLGIVFAGVYLWWNGWFSALFVESGVAPEGFKDSFESRQGLRGAGVGSAGAISMLFDTFCLVGWAGMAIFFLMKKFVVAIMERMGIMSGGLYDLVSGTTNARTVQAAEPSTEVSALKDRIVKALKNHEGRIVALEIKTSDIPDPEPPPPPKTLEEVVAEQAAMIEELRAAMKPIKAS